MNDQLDYVFGINPVTIALHNSNRIKSELMIAENKQGKSIILL